MSIDVDKLVERTTKSNYPLVLLTVPNQTIPLVVTDLMKGDTQLVLEYESKRKVISNISLSATNIDLLLRTCSPVYFQSGPTNLIQITSIQQYLTECI